MKILEIIPQLSQGGAERFVIDLCNELANGGHEVTLVVLHSIERTGFFAKEVDPKVRLVSMNKRMGMDWSLFFRLARLIRREKPDAVHTHLRGIVYSLLAFVRPSKTRFIHTVHSDAAKEAGEGVSKWCRKMAFGYKRVHPVTISDESQRSFSEFYHLPSTLIYNGRPPYQVGDGVEDAAADLQAAKTNKEAKIIVNVARIQAAKNQLALAKAVDSLNQRGHAVELAIIGRKDAAISAQIEALGSPFVHLLDTRPNPRDYMRAADAFCLSSAWEGMPITLIECFSVGALPLCTPVGGIVDMIRDGENGILAKSPAQNDLEEMIRRFLGLSDAEAAKMRAASAASFARYDMTRCAKNYISLFNQLN